VRLSRAQVTSRVHTIPVIRFEDQSLTSFGGAVVLQRLFQVLGLKGRMAGCFDGRLWPGRSYGPQVVMLSLVLHLMLGFRRLRDRDSYYDDPIVARVLGLRRLADVSTLGRTLADASERNVTRVRALTRDLVLERLGRERLTRLTLDFDGTVMSTKGHAEGTAVGFNRKHKGARSYYPLFCTVAQTGQIFDWLHRPGNVHDSNGAAQFMKMCFRNARKALPSAKLESRMDCAFFDERIVKMLEQEGITYSAGLPFERFTRLKAIVEGRKNWTRIDATWSYFETTWKPDKWTQGRRVIVFRKRAKVQHKGALQLDLFEPRDTEFQYKAVVTNKRKSADGVLPFHNGRGSQEGIFAEAKQHAQLDLIPCKRLVPNQLVMAAAAMAHNLGRELQMQAKPRARGTTPSRRALWNFETLGSVRQRMLQRAGRLTMPQGQLTLTMNANRALQRELTQYLDAMDLAA
jgi:hypothetical protein